MTLDGLTLSPFPGNVLVTPGVGAGVAVFRSGQTETSLKPGLGTCVCCKKALPGAGGK